MVLRKRYPRYDAFLDTRNCSSRTNLDLTLEMRMGFRPINPAGGANTGTYNDYGSSSGTPRQIVKWTPAEWNAWKASFCSSAQAYWDAKFWIDNRQGAFAVKVGKDVFIPNGYCRFKLIGSDASAGFHHHIIDVVRLAPSENWFGSHSTLYDSKDTNLVPKAYDSKGKPILQRAHVHEVGHLLGLGHVAIGQRGCPVTGDTNASPCYGTSDQDKKSVMGGGMRLDTIHGAAWLGAFNDFVAAQPQSPIYAPAPAKKRAPQLLMRRAYPRTVAEFEAGTLVTKLLPGR